MPVRELAKVGFIYVVQIRLQITEHRRQGIEPVVSQGDGLCVLEFRECLRIKPVVPLLAVSLGSTDVGFVSQRFAGQVADSRIVPAFRDVVIDPPLLFLPAQFTCNLCREVEFREVESALEQTMTRVPRIRMQSRRREGLRSVPQPRPCSTVLIARSN